ncbi:isopeptide-forming domain-containing fimbrial protein [Olsenella sp. YH-ols2221]|uniref:isopeptide-forming domain-containing fimbrial protein n=1 Tax=Olsenella kribbiana TaxID=3115221 RepID=UPI002EDA1398
MSCLTALAMILCGLCVPVSAYAKGTLELNASDGVARSYSAYKLLDGNVSGGGTSQTLSDVSYTDALPATSWQELGAPAGTAQDVADWLSANETPSLANEIDWKVEASGVAADKTDITTGETELEDGYWLITSADSSPVLVLVGGNATTEVTEKAEAPVLVKQVRTDGDWSDFAVAGNDVDPEYRLVGTLPTTYDSFPTYHYQFDDVMDESFTVDQSSVKVLASSADGSTTKDLTSDAEISLNGQKLTVNFADLKKVLPELGEFHTITVTYTAHLNTLATAGLAHENENDATLTYTRKPTKAVSDSAADASEGVSTSSIHAAKATLSHLPHFLAAASTTDTTSERQQAEVATWFVRLTKKDAQNGQELPKAGFTVQDAKGLYINTDSTATEEKTDASIWRTNDQGVVTVANLANGSYTFKEVEVPEGYKAASDVTITLQGDRKSLKASADDASVTGVDSTSGVVNLTIEDSEIAKTPDTNGGNAGTTSQASSKGSRIGMPDTSDYNRIGIAVLLIAVGIVAIVISRALSHKDKQNH